MKKLMLAAAALLLAMPVTAEDADLSIPAEQKTLALDEGGGGKKDAGAPKAKAKKKAVKKKERGAGYKFKAQESSQYKFDGGAKPLTGGKTSAPKKKAKSKEESGYRFRQEGPGSSYRLDDDANPIGKSGPKKKPAPVKPAAVPAKKDAPPPYDDSLSVDKKVISLEGE